jgi:pimeloyl-ACP methyl ester carboxylesterase
VKTRGEQAIATTRKPEEDRPVEACLAELLDHLGIVSAHFAGRGSADLQGFAVRHPERIASLTLLCPAVLDTPTLAPLDGRLLVVTGDHGPGARRVQAGPRDLSHVGTVVRRDYDAKTQADIAAEFRRRTDRHGDAEFRCPRRAGVAR